MATLTELRKKNTSSPPPQHCMTRHSQCSNAAKTQRLTENKRRYRARRKEYISDLESKLAEAREQGIQATKEVQLAARQVVFENGRLRELLGLVGFADEDIDAWAGCGVLGQNGDRANCDRRLEIERLARRVGTFASSHKEETKRNAIPHLNDEDAGGKETCITEHISKSCGDTPHSTAERLGNKPNLSDPSASRAAAVARNATAASEDASIPAVEGRAGHTELFPCKLLSQLAENPGADITIVPQPAGSGELLQGATCHRDIECSKAYEILAGYAVSEEKTDYVARTLKGGCRANGNGGCAVKSEVILQALDHMC